MSFRLFIYYCAICGGSGAFVGWVLGRIPTLAQPMGRAALRGLLLGMMVAFALGLIDTIWNSSVRHVLSMVTRITMAVAIGCLGGLLGGILGQAFLDWTALPISSVFGWTITGMLIGSSQGLFDLMLAWLRNEDARGAYRKLNNGLLGGALGGAIGGGIYLGLLSFWDRVFRLRGDDFWFPVASGFVALGACIGLLIGLTQIILKEAWIKVERGFRAGREILLTRPETTVGRSEDCDLGLFGDPRIEKIHARIQRQGNNYFLLDEDSQTGTFLNNQRIAGSSRLRSGDLIRLGKSEIRFGERQKRSSS